jgi:hypothetical protein
MASRGIESLSHLAIESLESYVLAIFNDSMAQWLNDSIIQ